MSGRLEDRVALVTGGAVGIGAAICELFTQEGAKVGVVDADADGARAIADRLGDDVVAIVADVTDLDGMATAVAGLEEQFGGLDVVINNAGVIASGTVETTTEAEWNRILSVNLTGVFLTSKAAIPALRRRGGGSIINVSSAAGINAWYDQAAYDASKGGCVNLTRSMALDFAADGIRVNCLVPAHVVTPMSTNFAATGGVGGADHKERLSVIPLQRYGTPMEIAYGALFLACSESSYATGSTLVLDGGYLAR